MVIGRHAFDVEVFQADDARPSDQPMAELVGSIFADINHPLVQPGQPGFRFLPVGTAFVFASQGPIDPPQPRIQGTVRFRALVDPDDTAGVARGFRTSSVSTSTAIYQPSAMRLTVVD